MKPSLPYFAAALVAAALVFGDADAQRRESLSERITLLEEKLAGDDASRETLADMVYQIDALEAEVRQLRGMVEDQAFAIEGLRRSQQDQYLDLDRRLARAESAMSGGNVVAQSPQINNGFSQPPTEYQPRRFTDDRVATADVEAGTVTPADTSLTMTEELPEVREEIDAQLETSGLGVTEAAQVTELADPAEEKAQYDEAFDALKNARYAEASRQFASFVQAYPNGEYADNAQYWLGESYYVTRNYRVALETFQRLLTRYPESSKVPDARLKIGLSYYSLKNWDAAEQELKSVVDDYPDSTVARLAQNRLRAMRIEGYID